MNRASSPRYAYSARGYAWQRSLATLGKRPWASSLSFLVLGIVLSLPILLFLVANSLSTALGTRPVEVSLTAYLALEINDLDGAALSEQLASLPGVARTRYLSRDEALATFEAESELGDALALLGDNPLPGAIIITPTSASLEPAQIDALAQQISTYVAIDEVRYDAQWVARLQALLRLIQVASLVLTAVLTLTAMLVIANTIRLELLARQSEREVCHLLGASGGFIRRPFVYSGLIYGFVGGLVATALAALAFAALKTPADELARLYGNAAGLAWPSGTRLALFPIVGAALGLIASMVSLHASSQQKIRSGI